MIKMDFFIVMGDVYLGHFCLPTTLSIRRVLSHTLTPLSPSPPSSLSSILKNGKIVIVLSGKYAGKKAVVLKTFERDADAKKASKGDRVYPNAALIVGIDTYPRRVTKKSIKENSKLEGDAKAEAEKKIAKRMTLKPFIKMINFTHIMPTRYNLDLSEELQKLVPDNWNESTKEIKGKCKTKLEERYRDLNKMKDTKHGTSAVYFFR
jgi:large subunit ribosomal protein L27e